ncbi:MAG: hypothetical protein QUV19_01825 [Alteromonas macleodii]|uniref:hypothetical protein n=1 Tax=Alteromonas TaxID=226 RepID=UPI00128A5B73|nr:hypothetical protein [Alteromonas macleodii]MED5521169.1 hypothetical protein [Pseudomonadota bacterium]MDM7960921.1 hypothetical protein [Alteromonas macleodii]MDM8169304.1 hypothetical protein [Alteromonas macleodii]CAI3968706.1 hypothetical protein EZ55_03788 [Alteromonas macleodii]VTP57697.1 hypothetical protein EZ55_03788 [Alteromonas macleodii]|tara:strand:+ start:1352 stop:1975 length:624 start_codon:yes stop_codon:yes gene_type:complete
MKTWLVLLLIAFALIAGYKFSGYQHQLSESNAEKERLTNVLARSRATETSELKVIKPAAKLVSNEAGTVLLDTSVTKNGEMNVAPVAENVQIMAPEVFYTKTEGSLNTFFALPPNNERFVLDSVKCENGHCEITGEYDGSETELSRVIEALEQEPWWEFGSPIITTQVAQRGLKLNVSFAASHSPNARVRYRNSTQADLNSQLASAG